MLDGQTQVHIPRFESFPSVMASSMVCGNLCPTVSGKKSANTPPMTAETPRISIGAEPPSRPISSANIAPILATVLQLPMAVLRITVGNSSAVYTYNTHEVVKIPIQKANLINPAVATAISHPTSVTRLGDLLDFGQLFKALGNN